MRPNMPDVKTWAFAKSNNDISWIEKIQYVVRFAKFHVAVFAECRHKQTKRGCIHETRHFLSKSAANVNFKHRGETLIASQNSREVLKSFLILSWQTAILAFFAFSLTLNWKVVNVFSVGWTPSDEMTLLCSQAKKYYWISQLDQEIIIIALFALRPTRF